MFMRMIYDEPLAQSAYLIGCQKTGEAILFDPLRDVDRYLALATANGLKIVAVAETHIHADFVSGARELADRGGARVYVSGEGGTDWQSKWVGPYPHTILKDGDTFDIGNIRFEVIHTPGHTPEHIVYVVTDRGANADAPIGVISGDFLFVGDLGRPDLLETAAGQSGTMERGAHDLYRSLAKLDAIPEFVQVWPGHGAGSACGKALGAVPMSTVGYERRFNPALALAENESGFVDFILDGQPEPPMYFGDMKRINRDGPPVLGDLPRPARTDAAGAASLDPRSVAIIDTRPWEDFIAGHLPGSLSFPLGQSFCTDVGSMVGVDEPICLIVGEDDLDETIRLLVRIGRDRIGHWCPPDVITGSDAASATIAECEASDLKTLLDEGDARVLDVRRLGEFNAGHIPGAANISHTRLRGRIDEVPGGDPLYVSCRSGKRSARSCAYLERMGHRVVNVRGGWLAWEKAGGTVEKPSA
jgi:hydroxyacylglutathione hydrolase